MKVLFLIKPVARKKGKAFVSSVDKSLHVPLKGTVESLKAAEEAEELVGNSTPPPSGPDLEVLTPFPRGADLRAPALVSGCANVSLVFEAPVPITLDDPAVPLVVVGNGVEDRLPGFGYRASEGMVRG